MKKTLLALVLLVLSAPRLLLATCPVLPANGDVANSSYTLLWMNEATRECNPWQPCWGTQFAKAKETALHNPNDVAGNLVYQAMALRLGPEKENALVASYLARAKAEPGNPVAQYLAAQLAPHATEVLAFLGQTLKLDPHFGPAYLDLAHLVLHPREIQDKKTLEKEYGSVESNIARFLKECPEAMNYEIAFSY